MNREILEDEGIEICQGCLVDEHCRNCECCRRESVYCPLEADNVTECPVGEWHEGEPNCSDCPHSDEE